MSTELNVMTITQYHFSLISTSHSQNVPRLLLGFPRSPITALQHQRRRFG